VLSFWPLEGRNMQQQRGYAAVARGETFDHGGRPGRARSSGIHLDDGRRRHGRAVRRRLSGEARGSDRPEARLKRRTPALRRRYGVVWRTLRSIALLL
jgi:hypothetical protein